MPNYLAPGVYVEEVRTGARPIEAVGTSTAGFIGVAPAATQRVNELVWIDNWTQFLNVFVSEGPTSTPLSQAVFGFFQNGGSRCGIVNVGSKGSIQGDGSTRTGLGIFERFDNISIIAAPGYQDAASQSALLTHCEKLKDRVAVLDGPASVNNINSLTQPATVSPSTEPSARATATAPPLADVSCGPPKSQSGYGASYYPWISVRDPLPPYKVVNVAPSGHIAGIYARTDSERGVHKAPANESIRGALGVSYQITRQEQETLNPNGVNCIRYFPGEGIQVYGARTTADSSSEWRYLNVRRLFIMIEASIARSTRWVVFEPNDRPLWKSIRRDVTAFLTLIWRQGALMGRTPEEAFFVQCDEETNTLEEIDAGRVVTVIGLAPVKPAEFVIFRIGQGVGGAKIE
jgi:uncharacterized protein